MSDESWIVEGLIPRNTTTMLLGCPSVGKSWLIDDLAVSVSGYSDFLSHFQTTLCRVVLIDEDTTTSVLHQRIKRLTESRNIPTDILQLDIWSMEGFGLNSSTDIKRLKAVITSSSDPVLVCFDCLDSVIGHLDSNKTQTAINIGRAINELKEAGATVAITHHMSLKKGEPGATGWMEDIDFTRLAMGNIKIIGFTDTVFGVWQVSQKPTLFAIRPKPRRFLLDIPPIFGVSLNEDLQKTIATMEYLDEIPNLPSKDAKTIAGLFTTKPDAMFTVKDIMEKSGEILSYSDLRAKLKELEGNKVITLLRGEHNMFRYQLHPKFMNLHTAYAEAIRNQ